MRALIEKVFEKSKIKAINSNYNSIVNSIQKIIYEYERSFREVTPINYVRINRFNRYLFKINTYIPKKDPYMMEKAQRTFPFQYYAAILFKTEEDMNSFVALSNEVPKLYKEKRMSFLTKGYEKDVDVLVLITLLMNVNAIKLIKTPTKQIPGIYSTIDKSIVKRLLPLRTKISEITNETKNVTKNYVFLYENREVGKGIPKEMLSEAESIYDVREALGKDPATNKKDKKETKNGELSKIQNLTIRTKMAMSYLNEKLSDYNYLFLYCMNKNILSETRNIQNNIRNIKRILPTGINDKVMFENKNEYSNFMETPHSFIFSSIISSMKLNFD